MLSDSVAFELKNVEKLSGGLERLGPGKMATVQSGMFQTEIRRAGTAGPGFDCASV